MIYRNTPIVNSIMMSEYSVTLLQKEQLTADVWSLRFTRPEGFEYKAGQFVQFLVPDEEKPVWRAYSLCSIPSDAHLEFCVKLLPDGKASGMFAKMNIGEALTIRGPRGHFANENGHDLFFVATGVGIAPIYGIIRDELERKQSDRPIQLLFGVRYHEDIFWTERLELLKDAHSNFAFSVTLSQPKPDLSWSGLNGRVTDHILHHLTYEEYFLCGSAAMVKDVRQLLLENGKDKQQIHFEIF